MLNYVEYGKENKYDDDIFFQKYSQMSRSQQGLAGAGEWETLRKLLPDFKDKRVLDLGCGYGWHCIYAMEHGASSVVGVDISHKMLEVAKEKTHFPQVEYKCCAIEDVEFPEESFDVILDVIVTSSMSEDGYLPVKNYLGSGKTIAFIGSSGVGKSTLINRLIGENILETNGLRNDDKGRHTTTRREMFIIGH